jgi:hypothetical protein
MKAEIQCVGNRQDSIATTRPTIVRRRITALIQKVGTSVQWCCGSGSRVINSFLTSSFNRSSSPVRRMNRRSSVDKTPTLSRSAQYASSSTRLRARASIIFFSTGGVWRTLFCLFTALLSIQRNPRELCSGNNFGLPHHSSSQHEGFLRYLSAQDYHNSL